MIHLYTAKWCIHWGQLQIKVLWTFMYKLLFIHMLSFFLGKYLGAEWLDRMADMLNFLRYCHSVFQSRFQKSVVHMCMSLFLDSVVGFVNLPTFMPMTYCFDDYSFILCLKIKTNSSMVLFQSCLVYSVFTFPYEF